MEIILNKSLENVGEEGDVVSVKDGYARNYLIPNGYAKNATKKNILAIQKEIKNREIQEAKNRQNLEALNKQLNKLSLKFELKNFYHSRSQFCQNLDYSNRQNIYFLNL